MADDDVTQTRSRCTLRWSVALAALSTAAVAVAEALGELAPAPPPADDVVDEPAAGYDGWTVANLRTRARQLGVTGYSKLRKADLVAALQERDAPTG